MFEKTITTAWAKEQYGFLRVSEVDAGDTTGGLCCVHRALYHLGLKSAKGVQFRMVGSNVDPGFPTWRGEEVFPQASVVATYFEAFAKEAATIGADYFWLESK